MPFANFAYGPLDSHISGFATLLTQLGYGEVTGWNKIRLAAEFGRWMVKRRIRLVHLDESHVDAFLRSRWKTNVRRSGDLSTLTLLLKHVQGCRDKLKPSSVQLSPVERLKSEYECFLINERGLVAGSAKQYLHVTNRFLLNRFPDGTLRLKQLRAEHVTDFVLQDSACRGRRSAQLMASALRSFFGFLLQYGKITRDLAKSVPAIAGWRLSELPRFLEAADVEKLLKCCDRKRSTGKRDFAILLLLARLGLRAGEVASLNLDEIDWSNGELLIRGKGARVDRLPLLEDVGQAIGDYLRNGRPLCASRRVFIQSKAPYTGFSQPPNAICGIVRRALQRAELSPRHHGAHLLRHSLATRMLSGEASLATIGQVLRHQLTQTTEIYAKVDLVSLRGLVQPWPGTNQ